MRNSRFALVLLLAGAPLWCQQPPASAAQQPATATSSESSASSVDDRIKALEDRIIALEGQLREIKSLQQSSASVENAKPAAAPTQPTAPEPVRAADASAPPPVYGGATGQAKALNPDISLIGDFLGAIGGNSVRPVPSMAMHETELGIQAVIDPYARADVFISFGEQGVNLEEGYATFTSLPAGFVARVGKMRAAFGKVNTLHNHVLPWTDRPLVTENLVGGEDGIDDAGFSITRILPAPKGILLEATGQLFRGDSSDVFKSFRKNDVSAIAHLHGYKDLSESANVDIGLSYGRGHNDSSAVFAPQLVNNFLTHLYGIDTTVRWKPLRRSIYHSFVARSEFIWSQRQQPFMEQRGFGFYTSGDYQLGRRWFVGERYDWSDRSHDASLTDRGASAVLTYWPSEFAQLRAQYRFTRYAEGIDTNELRLQLQFALGAHGAHPF